ncbi:hypothetical protein J1614_006122 [Plenodomus biglobosus]|nr:hypothetical protein J1614_006122 [Plenodomus biglobosus]
MNVESYVYRRYFHTLKPSLALLTFDAQALCCYLRASGNSTMRLMINMRTEYLYFPLSFFDGGIQDSSRGGHCQESDIYHEFHHRSIGRLMFLVLLANSKSLAVMVLQSTIGKA